MKTEVYDYAKGAFSNKPDILLYPGSDSVLLGPFWDEAYYFGRTGSDQFNLIDCHALEAVLKSRPAEGLEGFEIWVVKSCLENNIEYIQFTLYHADTCLTWAKGRSWTCKTKPLTKDTRLVNGWSSRASVFNTTGIRSLHYMEVTLVEGEQYQFANAPVRWVEQQLQGSGWSLKQAQRGTEVAYYAVADPS